MLLLSPEQLPASVSIFTFFGNYGAIAFGELAAFSVLYSTPVILLYILISKRLGGGCTLGGAVKGWPVTAKPLASGMIGENCRETTESRRGRGGYSVPSSNQQTWTSTR
ncbi:hypothetical protein GCM10010341_03790 [Streptomyces noursei]|nr:hypothetical protein GCM10010341_03790 [Streptomyces noursei]